MQAVVLESEVWPVERKSMHKPAFNMIEPFIGVYMVQMNKEMCQFMADFIDNVVYVEEELKDLSKAFRNLSGEGTGFHLSNDYMHTFVLRLNKDMRYLLINFITDIEGGVEKIIWAFHLALKNPDGQKDLRIKKRYDIAERPNPRSMPRSKFHRGYSFNAQRR
jgi:hypothetical protein